MKHFIRVLILGAVCALGAGAALAQTGHELFQRALSKERAEGNLPEAIRLYERIVKEHATNRPLAAKALFQLGQCYEKLGKEEARKAYERILREFGDQAEAAEARTRLAAMTKPAAPKTTEPVVRQVWAGPNVDTLGAPSADGKYLTFVDWETGDLALRDLATGENRRLTNKGPWMQSVEMAMQSVPSPDGKQVAYAWLNPSTGFELRVLALDGAEAKPKALHSSPMGAALAPAAWSPDGRQILTVLGSKSNTNQIAWVSGEDGAVRVLKTLDWRFPAKVSLSPDGRYIVYDFPPKATFPQRDIFLLAADGSSEIPLVQHSANDLLPVWAPDGKRVIFASDRTGTMGVWSIRVADGKPQGAPELLKPDIGRISTMAFTQDGRLYYGLNTGMTDVYVGALDPATGRILEPPAPASQSFVGSNRAPDWSPDGKYLAYLSRRVPGLASSGPSPIIIRTLATGEERELLPAMSTYGPPRWSPDGREFLLHGRDKQGRRGVYRVDAQTGAAELLIPLEPATYGGPAPVWSPDGKKIFYTYPKDKELVLRMRDLQNGEEKVLFTGNALNLTPSPDGQWLAFNQGGQALLLVPLPGGEPRELLRPQGEWFPQQGLAWTPDSKFLLFAKAPMVTGQPASLWRISVQGGEPQNLNLNLGGAGGIFLRLHPDGRRIAFTFGQAGLTNVTSELWVMENFLRPVGEPAMTDRRVLSGPNTDPIGTPSPDGRYLAITDWTTGDLALHDLTTNQARRLTNKGSWMESYEFGMFPKFSPDGKQLAYAWFTMENIWQLRLISTEGGEPRVLASDKSIEMILPLGWTPDGRQIGAAFIRPDGNQAAFVSARDGAVRVVKTYEKSPSCTGGTSSLSPDGRYFVYDCSPHPDRIERDIYLLSADGKTDIPIVQHPADDLHPVWTPDGRRIIFASDRRGSLGLWSLEVVNGKPRGEPQLVRSEIGQFWPMGFTQSGAYFYGLNTRETDIHVARLDVDAGKVAEEAKLLGTRHVGGNIGPAWSPDGKWLAYVTRRGPFAPAVASIVIAIRSAETGPQRDFRMNLNSVRQPSWSPDSRSILFNAEDRRGILGLYQMDAQSGELKKLLEMSRGANMRWPQFLPDGKSILFERLGDPPRTRVLIVRNLATGEEKELARALPPYLFGGVSLSPDGRQIAFVWSEQAPSPAQSLRVISVEGGEARVVFQRGPDSSIPARSAPQWTPDGNHILIVQGSGPAAQPRPADNTLWRISLRDGSAQSLGLTGKQIRDLSLHPDGKRLAFVAGESGAEIWVMENFLPVLKAAR